MSEFKAVQLKRSTTASTVPSSAQLVEGELAINLVDQKLYSKNSAGVFELKGTVDDGTITTPKLASATITSLTAAALAAVYPIGSQYVNFSNSANPATLLGLGTWVAVSGRVIVGIDPSDASFDTIGETGGSKDAIVVSHNHSATVTDPGHTHSYKTYGLGNNGLLGNANTNTDWGTPQTGNSATNISVAVNSTGSSGANANLQPYVVAYVWKRTA